MSDRAKRILLAIILVFVVIGLGFAIYAVFLRPSVPTPPTTGGTGVTPTSTLPTTGQGTGLPISGLPGTLPPGAVVTPPTIPQPPAGTATTVSPVANGGVTGIKRLTDTPGYGITLDSDGNGLIFYDRASGKFYRINPDGSSSPISDEKFTEASNAVWAPNRQKAVIEFPDGANIVYDFAAQKKVTLPKHWADFDFAPNSDQLVFKSLTEDPENRWLAVSKADGSQATKIEHLGDKDATVFPDWSPNNQMVASFIKPVNSGQQELYFIGLNDENFKSTIVEGRGFVGKWTPQGNRLLYSVYKPSNEYRPELWIVDAQGQNIGNNRRALNIETWADKCEFANTTTLYCAVPRTLRAGAGLFRNDLDAEPTDIYKIDLNTGFKSLVAIPAEDHNIQQIQISADQQYLYFTSRNDGRVYQIRLQ